MTDIRRRRGGDPEPNLYPVESSQFSNQDSTTFASTTLAPTFQGYIGRLLGVILGIYLWVEVKLETMVFGVGRWVTGQNTQAGQAQDGIPLLQKDQSTVRRRRRKDEAGVADGYYPGMVNLSGVLCYMNSVLQSLASVTSLVAHLERITLLAVETDLPTPVTDALADVLAELNTPHSKPPRPIRPHNLLAALHPLPQIRRLLSTREQQDAHELFVVLSEAISDEALKVVREIVRLRGIADILSLQAYCTDKGAISSPVYPVQPVKERKKKVKGLAQPWEGLIARRRVCRQCGYHTEVRMDTLGGMELPLPMSGDVSLESCIGEYLAPELLSEVTCELCSLRTTLDFYREEAARLSLPPNKAHLTSHASPTTPSGTFSVLEHLPKAESSGIISDKRKKKAKDARKIVQRLEEMADSGAVTHYGEDVPVPGKSDLAVKWRKSNSDSIRECILTRSPPTLRLHLDRSGYTPYGQSIKKSARVAFPIILDLTPFIARGVWEERTNLSTLLTQTKPASGPRVLYRLESAILHYGYTSHSGHFICIRRKPSDLGSHHGPKAVRKSCPDECRCEQCIYFGKVRGEQSIPGKGWLQVSDDDIEEVGEEALMDARSAVFMLFYERVGECSRAGEAVRDDETESQTSSSVALDV